jgi:hypothetical protein
MHHFVRYFMFVCSISRKRCDDFLRIFNLFVPPLTARVILLPPSGPTIASSSLGKLQIDKLWFVDGFQPLHLHNLKAVVGKCDEIIVFFYFRALIFLRRK